MNDLVEIKQDNMLEVFENYENLEHYVNMVKSKVDGMVFDCTTPKGRDECASWAYKIKRSKTYLDSKGKDLVAELKALPKKIDANRKKMREELDALADTIRSPLNQWEQAEKERRDSIEDEINNIISLGELTGSENSQEIKSRIEALEKYKILESFFQEFSSDAADKLGKAKVSVKTAYDTTLQREKDQAELDELRRKQEEMEREIRERKLIEEAKEKARLEAEEAARVEAEKAKHELEKAKIAHEQARINEERLRIEAEEAKELAKRMQEQERQRIEEEKRQVAAQKKLEKDRIAALEKMRYRLIQEASNALEQVTADSDKVLTAIMGGTIPHVRFEGDL